MLKDVMISSPNILTLGNADTAAWEQVPSGK